VILKAVHELWLLRAELRRLDGPSRGHERTA
jgi:hypothetical protein